MAFTGKATYSRTEESDERYPYSDITPSIAINMANQDKRSTWKQLIDKYRKK